MTVTIAVSAAVSTVRSSQEPLPDGISEDAPVLLDSPDSNGINGSLEEERSPVEESGREVEVAAEGEVLGSAVEEGEEAALALDVPSPQAKRPAEDEQRLTRPSTEPSSPTV